MKKYLIILSFLGVFIINFAFAKDNFVLDTSNIKLTTSWGLLGGESKEYVYSTDNFRKISELDWNIKGISIIKANISLDPLNWLSLNAGGWSSLASGSTRMDDYDWLNSQQASWTDWSTHPNTRFNYANKFDINMTAWVINQLNYRVGGIIGYQQARFSWTSFGGQYRYNNGADMGELPRGEREIGYQLKLSLPYLGIAAMYRFKDLEFNALLNFSTWATAKDNDKHYMRDLTFRDQANNSRYYSTSLDAGYYVTPNAKIFTELTLSRFCESRAGTHVIDNASGESQYIGGEAAGIENKNYNITGGLQYHF